MSRGRAGESIGAVLARARERAPVWYPDLDPNHTTARVERRYGRQQAAVHVLSLDDGKTSHRVAVKTLKAQGRMDADPGLAARPTMLARAEAGELPVAWYRGLVLANRHFETLADPRLGSVRPLDLWGDLASVVMEYNGQPTLRTRIVAAARWNRAGAEIDTLVGLAGQWLREYHAAGRGIELPPRCPTRTDFQLAIEAFSRYLLDLTGEAAFFKHLEEMAARAADRHLPTEFPLEVAHGDYAPRNIFVGPEDRVTGFDATPRVKGPVFEDVARFLVAVRTGGFQVVSIGRAYPPERMDELEERFLTGYFGQDRPPPVHSIRPFELLALLNKFSAVVSRSTSRSFGTRMRARVRARFYYRRFREEVNRIGADLDASASR